MEEKTKSKKIKKALKAGKLFRGKNLTITILSVLVIVLLVSLAYADGLIFKPNGEKIAQMAINSLNNSILKNKGTKAELSGKVEENSGVYQFKLKINGQEFTSYVTKDGKLLFPDAIKLTKQASAEKSKSACQKIKKSDNPQLEAFVVSYCPFGLQMQRMITELAKDNPAMMKYIKIKYIGDVSGGKIKSMHGDKEAKENLRQICIREEQPNKYIPYLTCFIKDGKYSKCLNEAKIDKAKLNECEKNPKKGIAYAKKDFAEADKYGVSGSPTLFLNKEKVSEFDFGGRTAEALQKLICCSLGDKIKACSINSNNKQAARSFSETYSGGGNNSGGSCN